MQRWLCPTLVLVCVTIARAAHGLVVLPADLDDLVSSARLIVHGVVVGVRPQLAQDRRQIETLVSVDVSRYLKGDFGPEVTFRVPGGELGRFRTVIVGAPVFAPGDEVVVFLGARGPIVPYVLGLSQGLFRVRRQSGTDGGLVVPGIPSEPAAPIARGSVGRQPVPLAQFLASVQQRMGAR
jgi:hypothetical protein